MLKAMLVDDEYYALEGLKIQLEQLGQVTVIAMYEQAHQALDHIAQLQPDVVFLDIDMPQINGLELFDKLLELSPQTRIVFVTAYNEYAVEAFELNAVDYIVKPIHKERLLKTIERLKKTVLTTVNEQPMSIHCFGHLSIKLEAKELDIPWRTKKVEELLAYLVCCEGDFVSKEKLAEVLWPELDMEKSKSNFYLAYHYLKKQSQQLGIKFPLESSRGKIRIKTEEVTVDLLCFKDAIQGLETIKPDTINLAEKAAQLYTGMLLEQHYYAWSTVFAQHYEMLYMELIQKLVVYYEGRNLQKYSYYLQKLQCD
jgi:two-component SAPR family response regulator